MTPRHLLAAADLEVAEIEAIFAAARAFAKAHAAGESLTLLKGRTVVNLFFENSTRTRLSFEVATRRLNGAVLNFAVATSSVSKGETLVDTARNLEALGGDCFVIRHASAGTPAVLARALRAAVVNAGDGFHEHPTQGLLDVFTMVEKLGGVRGKRVLILGDIAHSRVARSNIHLLRKLGADVSVCGPPTLLPPNPEALGVRAFHRPEDCLRDADVVMTLRIQLERQNRMQIPSLSEYAQFWGINRARAQLLKKTAILMHPGPINPGVEVDPEVADGEHSVILDQVAHGIVIRMAVLARAVAEPSALAAEVKRWS